ncbi:MULTISPECIES: type IV pilus biogenesis protein PilM [Brevibacillus]|jgi:type IV pilus assembly protein PilM|uniref:Tfp pilus assembly protein, ATPase PilM n=3 Tax=Bacilli TaxID=91061 RepID=M8DTG6_9BACL|nr:pilus assembly protein PilM [Brevibacillus borstelensis]EMT50256.1 Tfp pilus assembly protein, ATPase PilM [Brevibacillus borstelensis AK1]MCM3561065.1 pilus assembly protein PilM [Brevibacillus borstelensis]MCM3592613.1 pilus assembly protein PilM [Brevibacillus borstelensis]MCM3623530.1 pilus assembly protein PilM [Brevibacillus borstelensis]MED1874279.1 pilus assembly protein PilM [Brevibacillus borstelensis]
MKLRIPFMTNPVRIGIAVEEDGLRFTEARRTDTGVEIRQAGLIPLEEGTFENGRITDIERVKIQLTLAKKELRLSKKKAVLSVPTSTVVIRKTIQPKLTTDDIRSLLEIELGTTIHLPFARPYFDFHKIREVPPSLEMDELGEYSLAEEPQPEDEYLVIAAPGDLIDQYIELLKVLDIEVTAVDIEPLALYRLLEESGEVHKTDFMFLQLGRHSVNVSIFQSDIPEFLRNIPIHLAHYEQASASGGTDGAAAVHALFVADLVREVDRVINFYQFSMKNDGTRIQTIYVTGEDDDLEHTIQLLKNRMTSFEIVPLPIHHIRLQHTQPLNVQAFTAAAGLTLRG